MKKILRRAIGRYRWLISRVKCLYLKPDFSTVFFEGGLGSQILSMIQLMNLSRGTNVEVAANCDYFERNEVFTHDNGLTHWKWALDRYGIHREELVLKFKAKASRRREQLRLSPSEFSEFICNNSLFRVDDEIKSNFPITTLAEDRSIAFFEGRTVTAYAVIHIRKGDYLKVASKIVKVDEVVSFLDTVRAFMPKEVIVISDGEFTHQEISSFEWVLPSESGFQLRFYGSESKFDEYLCHDLMRLADFLVTSNSTFSFTAGILSEKKNSSIFFPTEFYAHGSNLNLVFQKSSTFSLISK